MATRKTRPPRAWRIDDLRDLGRKEGDRANYLKAGPVLILEKWVLGQREEDTANYVWTEDVAQRLESSGLASFRPKGRGIAFVALTVIQNSRNLTRPRLIENQGDGCFLVSLPHYEPLLQQYRQEYSEHFPEDYRKLFPQGEPEWEQPRGRREEEPSARQHPDVQATFFSDSILQIAQQYERHWRENLQGLGAQARLLEQENERLRELLDQAHPTSDEVTDSAILSRHSKGMVVMPVLGQPGQPKKKIDVFVLMPFLDALFPVYDDHIRRVAKRLKLEVGRADDFFTTHEITSDIWDAICGARAVIADCTHRNPNVFYELGLAHVVGKPVILITQNGDDVPFDLKYRRYIEYEFTPRGMEQFEKRLEETLRTVLDLQD